MSVDASVSIVLAAFVAVEQRDERRLRALCRPDVAFHWPPSLPVGGSRAGGGDRWSAVWDRVQPSDAERRMDPRVVAATDREVVVLWRRRGSGRPAVARRPGAEPMRSRGGPWLPAAEPQERA